MDSFNFQQNIKVKVEKNNAILRYKRLQRVTFIFRFIELCIFFFIISRFSTQLLPSAEYFKGLCITLISPLFVFILGNAIVIILFLLKSCQSITKDSSTINPKSVSYDDPKVIFYHKACISSDTKVKRKIYKAGFCDDPKVDFYKACISSGGQVKKKIYRSQSEKLTNKLSHGEVPNNRELRRSAMVACGRYDEKPVAEMTDEEFRHTVEAFIARKQKLLREEEFSAVVSSEA